MKKKFQKPSDQDLKQKLSPIQYDVTQHDATEPPFQNEFWDNHAEGLYVDVVSGEPLFSSKDKFDSGCGWPSFTKPLVPHNVAYVEDLKLRAPRLEVRSVAANSHLGHVFEDGPQPLNTRYCINSASLRFFAFADLEKEGYGEFKSIFSNSSKQTATLAAGCFWGVEHLFKDLHGVTNTEVGYVGGDTPDPKYPQVKTGTTGHAEAVQIEFDASQIAYEDVLHYFFKLHDPTTLNQQGNDKGTQYRSAIFYHSEEQKLVAERVMQSVQASGKWPKPLVTQILPATTFYLAETYHQDYLDKNPQGYMCHFVRD